MLQFGRKSASSYGARTLTPGGPHRQGGLYLYIHGNTVRPPTTAIARNDQIDSSQPGLLAHPLVTVYQPQTRPYHSVVQHSLVIASLDDPPGGRDSNKRQIFSPRDQARLT